MKLAFKDKAYQIAAVNAVCDCFTGQPKQAAVSYRLDPGHQKAQETYAQAQDELALDTSAFRNADIELTGESFLENLQRVQKAQNLPPSKEVISETCAPINLDVEMETGTGKTLVFLKTIFELNRRYGWSKFIIVVPSIAIREGIHKSLQITVDYFLRDYQKRARFFIYNSSELHQLESYSSDAGINVMIINTQAFAAAPVVGAAQRTVLNTKNKIYRELDDFQSRRPIDVIKANRPILILDEPQNMEGAATKNALKEFNALAILRYSATHKKQRNLVHRLDALDAYNQKLVKKIAVHGIAQTGTAGASAYFYLEGITLSKSAPVARLELELKSSAGTVSRKLRKVSQGDNLYELSGGLEQYKGYKVSSINAVDNIVTFLNGETIRVGMATGDLSEKALRRIQIREAIRAHFQKEQKLHERGIKVLTLFFIDEVAKYRSYEDGSAIAGEYATAFEEEYTDILNEFLELGDSSFQNYIKQIKVSETHNGYFSVDKKVVSPFEEIQHNSGAKVGDIEASSYSLIMKDKERLLSFEEPTRFIFSHSALREGWDNPNVFVICPLKHTDNDSKRRQEVGRGMRLCVNQEGERLDDPETTHEVNELTVVANESYDDFVNALQKEIRETLKRPTKASNEFFTGKVLTDKDGSSITLTKEQAGKVSFYLIANQYIDSDRLITDKYHTDKENGDRVVIPEEELEPYSDSLFELIDSIFSEKELKGLVDNSREKNQNSLNQNFYKKEFQELWGRINHKAAYSVSFDSEELINKAVEALNTSLVVNKLRFRIQRGEMETGVAQEDLENKGGFSLKENESLYNEDYNKTTVKYDLVGEISQNTALTRHTVGTILEKMDASKFAYFKANPEEFITKVSKIIKEQQATMIVEYLSYNIIDQQYDTEIFTTPQTSDLSKAFKADNHIYDYVVTDSNKEREFVQVLDTANEVIVYAKLPRGFSIPTPVGNYNPDWAISFKEGTVQHLYFIAETKGSMSTLELRPIEKAKISCAKKFFKELSKDAVKYDVVDSYESLIELVKP